MRAPLVIVSSQLLTACEHAFGAQMPSIALNDIHTVDDAARYWEQRHREMAATRDAEESHWTRDHPPNVTLIRRPRSRSGKQQSNAALRGWLSANAAQDPRSSGGGDQTGAA
jgi:hypothetical protein